MTNADAVTATIKALRADGKLGDADEAVVRMAEALALAVDDEPGNAALWREYRAALTTLMTTGSGQGDDDTQAFLIAVSTPVGYGAHGSANVRHGRGGGGEGDGSASDAVAKPRRGRGARAAT